MSAWDLGFVLEHRGLGFIALVFLQITAVVGVAWILARGRSPVLRSKVWAGALAACLYGPALIVAFELSNTSLVSLEVLPMAEPPTLAWRSLPPAVDLTDQGAGGIGSATPSPTEPAAIPVPAADPANITESGTSSASPSEAIGTWLAIRRVAPVAGTITVIGFGALWSLGMLIGLWRIARSMAQVKRLRASAKPLDAEQHADLLAAVAGALKGHPLPCIAVSEEVSQPMALGGSRRAMVVVPGNLMQTLKPSALRDVLVHECAHVIQGDLRLGWFQTLAHLVYWLHPGIHFLNRKLSIAREELCDNYVLDQSVATDYARTLVALCEQPDADLGALACGLITPRWSMEQRVAGLLDSGRSRSIRMGVAASATVLAGLFCAACAIGGTRFDHVTLEVEHGMKTADRVLIRGSVVAPDRKPAADAFAATLSAGEGTVDHSSKDPDFQFRGKVVGPKGAPVSGAKVVASVGSRVQHSILTIRTVRTDDKGHFTLGYDKSDLPFDPANPTVWKNVSLSAHAAGHGADWVKQGKLEDLTGITLRLVADHTLRGRLVDENGLPLARTLVRLVSLTASVDESLTNWHKALKGNAPWHEANKTLKRKFLRFPVELAPSARTNKKGEFELHSIGRDRFPNLECLGGDAAYGNLRMVTRVVDSGLLARAYQGSTVPVYSSGGVVVARRSRPIEGVVRDASTGKPMASVDVFSHTISSPGRLMLDQDHKLRAKTDAQGRFRLLGFPKGRFNTLVVVPGDDQPYFMREVRLPDPDGMALIQVEVSLNRGVWITGKVVDGSTGRPGQGYITYYPHLFNPLVLKIDQFKKDRRLHGFRDRYRTKSDGTFRVVGLPGRGLVGVEAWGQYRQGAGCDPSWKLNSSGRLLLLDRGGNGPGPTYPTAMCRVDVPADAATVDCKLTLDAGLTMTLDVVDPKGVPVARFVVRGAGTHLRKQKVEGAHCEVRQLGPTEQRIVSIRVPDRGLGAVTRVRAGVHKRRSLTLKATAKIRGRLVDQDGAPLGQAMITLFFLPENHLVRHDTFTDKDGAFTFEGVLPGSDYRIYINMPKRVRQVAAKIQITPGKEVDLGVVKIEVPR